MPEEQGDKRFDPTPHHLEQARKKGNIAKGQDIISFATLLAAIGTLLIASPFFVTDLRNIFASLLDQMLIGASMRYFGWFLIKWVLIVAIPVGTVGILMHVIQNAVQWSTESINPKFDRINPAENIKQVVSFESLFMIVKALISTAILVFVIVNTVRRMNMIPVAENLDLAPFIRTAVFGLLPFLIWLTVMSIGDMVFSRLRHRHKLKMTVQQMKEELKQTEGDPLIKSKLRSARNALLRQSLEQQVASANVVITNPVHLAVAIKYDPTEDDAPVLVAKGARKMAEKIKKLARENKIPVVENPPVAQLLFRFVDVGAFVPEKFYKIVAEVLALIYQSQNKGGYAGI